jgi:hypothetical protein
VADIQQLPERYRKRIRVDDAKGCWLWLGAKTSKGRGNVKICGRAVSTHRFFFELLIGPVPSGMELHHKCEVPTCCNPDHLKVRTRLQHRRIHLERKYANREKTHCPRGHPFNQENTHVELRNGKFVRRRCKTCRRERKKGLTYG